MKEILLISQLIVSILMTLLILAQNKEGGLSSSMGGNGASFKAEKRGAEKVIFRATVFFAFLFVANAFAIIFF